MKVFHLALFWGASFKKVPLGAWVPLVIGCILFTLMVFWVWAKDLEDAFDGKTRMNLRHFIGQSQDVSDIDGDDDRDHDLHYFLKNDKTAVEKEGLVDGNSVAVDLGGDKKKLQRIPTCAIFHKIASGKGVPHTFIGTFCCQRRVYWANN